MIVETMPPGAAAATTGWHPGFSQKNKGAAQIRLLRRRRRGSQRIVDHPAQIARHRRCPVIRRKPEPDSECRIRALPEIIQTGA